MRFIPALAVLPLLLSSCVIFTGGGEPPCEDSLLEPAPSIEKRDPNSGLCSTFGGGGGGGGGTCGNWGGDERPGLPTEDADWATCYQGCEGLDEVACQVTPSCRVAYGDTGGQRIFLECWGTAPSGPIQGACEGLDAYQCSRHDDCSAVHGSLEAPGELDGGFQNALGPFIECLPERPATGCYSDLDCGDDVHCNANDVCLPGPGCGGGTGSGQQAPCDEACYGYCVPDIVSDPGECVGEVLCEVVPPDCPSNSYPGILDGCWTGFCIPANECEALPECGALTEQQCTDRSDCGGIYEGVDCSCNGDACTCTEWDYQRCTVVPN